MSRVIFMSSVQGEFAEERKAIRDFVRGETLLKKHFDVFLFEDQPAQSRGPVQLYTEEVEGCDVYIVLIGSRYGFVDKQGISPTEHEFDRAVATRKHRMAFVKAGTEQDRDVKEAAFIKKVGNQLKWSEFCSGWRFERPGLRELDSGTRAGSGVRYSSIRRPRLVCQDIRVRDNNGTFRTWSQTLKSGHYRDNPDINKLALSSSSHVKVLS